MADAELLAILRGGADAWNRWRYSPSGHYGDLSGVDLMAELGTANLRGADLHHMNLTDTKMPGELQWANLEYADLTRADLRDARLKGANLSNANLTDADLRGVFINDARGWYAKFAKARLMNAYLWGTDFREANFEEANLTGADLRNTQLVKTNFRGAQLVDCKVFGIAAWDVTLDDAVQRNLRISLAEESPIYVDDMNVAQFLYLLIDNRRLREVIDTITSKVVLILGRFTPERKAVLDAIRAKLREHNYVPILFDFEPPTSRDLTDTIRLLAGMARFVVADVTDPSSIPQELQAIVPDLVVPVQLLIEGRSSPYSMLRDFKKYPWVLPLQRYEEPGELLSTLMEKVITPAETKAKELQNRENPP